MKKFAALLAAPVALIAGLTVAVPAQAHVPGPVDSTDAYPYHTLQFKKSSDGRIYLCFRNRTRWAAATAVQQFDLKSNELVTTYGGGPDFCAGYDWARTIDILEGDWAGGPCAYTYRTYDSYAAGNITRMIVYLNTASDALANCYSGGTIKMNHYISEGIGRGLALEWFYQSINPGHFHVMNRFYDESVSFPQDADADTFDYIQ